jgi:hypothetical protein
MGEKGRGAASCSAAAGMRGAWGGGRASAAPEVATSHQG